MEPRKDLLSDIHLGLDLPPCSHKTSLVRGKYDFYHYKCDSFDDVGWGCGYRTLQTICSWLCLQKKSASDDQVPTIPQIQAMLVDMEDKPAAFKGSRHWIGSFEVCLIVDKLFDVPCKIIHVASGLELDKHFHAIEQHFDRFGSPVMMGGDQDASSKGILGTCTTQTNHNYLLVLDPHYCGTNATALKLQKKGYIQWVRLQDFLHNSFYNLCLPQFRPT